MRWTQKLLKWIASLFYIPWQYKIHDNKKQKPVLSFQKGIFTIIKQKQHELQLHFTSITFYHLQVIVYMFLAVKSLLIFIN